MIKLMIYIFFIVNALIGQNTIKPNALLNKTYNKLVDDKEGSLLKFNYYFENDAHKIKVPIKGSLAIFSNNRFYLNFNEGENEMIQIYNGEYISTILIQEKEILIDNMDESKNFLIHNIFQNYESRFELKIKYHEGTIIGIELTPKPIYNEIIYNECIDEVGLPTCLKLPSQCKIGIQPLLKQKLQECINTNNGYKHNNIVSIEMKINSNTLEILSINQVNRHNGVTDIEIINTEKISGKILEIDTLYKEFEIIDLR